MKLFRKARPKLLGPAANGFVGDLNPALPQQLFYIAMAEWNAVTQPDRVADDLGRKAKPMQVAGAVRHRGGATQRG